MKIVLASSSPYRRQLLQRLRLDFSCVSPDVDESPVAGERIEDMVVRLSELKASAAAKQLAADPEGALIIASDQSAVLNGQALTKPGDFDTAVKQLQAASGQRIVFQTGLCVLNTLTGNRHSLCEPYTVVFRELSQQTIEKYLQAEQPYNCAGSFKSEGLGVVLFEKFEGDDPNSLIGLPLIKLSGILIDEGIELPA